MVWLNL
jgi:hypothetical protein